MNIYKNGQKIRGNLYQNMLDSYYWRLKMDVRYKLFFIFIPLRIIDFILTIIGLNMGFQELNPYSLNIPLNILIFNIFIIINYLSLKYELKYPFYLLQIILIIFIFCSLFCIFNNLELIIFESCY